MYPDKFAALPSGYMKWWDADTFSCMLLALHQRTVLDKESCFLFSPSVFNPKKCEGADRGKENIVYVQNVWLDFEDGDLKRAFDEYGQPGKPEIENIRIKNKVCEDQRQAS